MRVEGPFRERLNLNDEKYKGSDESQLIINDVRKKDEARYEAEISKEGSINITSNGFVLRGFGGILLNICKKDIYIA